MTKLISSAFLVLLGMGLMYFGMGHHIVKTDKGRIYVPKAKMALSETFADVTQWKTEDLEAHPEVVKALINNGHQDVIAHLVAGDIKSRLGGLVDSVLNR